MVTINLNHESEFYTRMTFPDGQPHIKINSFNSKSVNLISRITNPTELMEVCMVGDILWGNGKYTGLTITYLMGARMDRPIDDFQPYTLNLITEWINKMGFDQIKIFDPHSSVTTHLLHNSVAISNKKFIEKVLDFYPSKDRLALISPDQGATHKVDKLGELFNLPVVHAFKNRDSKTGQLSGFSVEDHNPYKRYLIVDDICDGGGTFAGIASLLPSSNIDLAVSHGIFSKGPRIDGINKIFTTTSYKNVYDSSITVFDVEEFL